MTERCTVGWLITRLERHEHIKPWLVKTAPEILARWGPEEAAKWRAKYAGDLFEPDPVSMPGISRIVLLCDELENGNGLTAANVKMLRAKTCRAKSCTLEEANQLLLEAVADTLEQFATASAASGHNDTKKKRVGRPRKSEKDSDAKVISALELHHKYDDGSVTNYEPASTLRLAELAGVDKASVSRFFKEKFKDRGYQGYVAACNRDARTNIGMLIKVWNGDAGKHLTKLCDEEEEEKTKKPSQHRRGRTPNSGNRDN